MEVIRTSRGGQKLLKDGFSYTKKKSRKNSIHWECSKRKSASCNGTVTTDVDVSQVTASTPHNHQADQFATEAMKVREEIKTHAKNSRCKTSQLVVDKLSEKPLSVRVAAGKPETISRAVRRVRRGNSPPEPDNISDIPELPEEYRTTGGADDLPFLLYDNYRAQDANENRVMVFGTEMGLRHMCDSEKWYMDGTFDTAPRQFKQLFIIRAAVDDVNSTCVYAFLPNKLQTTYEEVFAALLESCDRFGLTPNPTAISCDFELAIHRAIHTMLDPNIQIQACFYHLTQSTWRKIQSEGLSVLYKNDANVKHFCGMLDGLAFLSPDLVMDGIQYLQSIVPHELEGLLEYFNCTYVSGQFRSVRGPRGILRLSRTNSPRYPIEIWNVHDVTINGGTRTNNICEGWNSGFTHLVGHKNPGLWYAIQCIQKDQLNALTELERLRIGQPIRKRVRRETSDLQKKLKTLCEQQTRGTKSLPEFMQAIGHVIRHY